MKKLHQALEEEVNKSFQIKNPEQQTRFLHRKKEITW